MKEFQWFMDLQIKELTQFIKREEKSKWNPMYYLSYPAKASVIASKEQLKGCISGKKEVAIAFEQR